MQYERLLIEQIVRTLPSGRGSRGARHLRLGVGDDAAVIRPTQGMEWVVSCDQFLEGIHFVAGMHRPESVGYKALARATSDLAAVGAAPRYFLLSLALPAEQTSGWLHRFLSGMARAARQLGMIVAGGDTSRSSRVAIGMTVIGEIESGFAITRSGARPGDAIFVSGRLGQAQLGLEVIRAVRYARSPRWERLLKPHLYPQPRIDLGRWLSRRRLASAMIDISDGLSTDLGHICEASGVGAKVWGAKIPVVGVPRTLRRYDLAPLALALHGGEDYELLFTVPAKREHALGAVFQGLRLTRIGEITKQKGMFLCDASGRERRLEPQGWDPFRTPPRHRRT